jgi:hypothetical protein
MKYVCRITVLGASAVLMVACNSAANDWNTASNANTIPAYQAFLQKHGSDSHADDARARIAQIQDDNAWTLAQSENSETGYKDYLQQHATGGHAALANTDLTALQRAAAWKTAESSGSTADLQAFLEKYPTGAEADQAKQKLAALEGYRVQLAATRSKAEAERKLRFAKQHFRKELGDVEITSPSSPDSMYRVLSNAMSQQDASSACQAVKRAHEACEVVGAS